MLTPNAPIISRSFSPARICIPIRVREIIRNKPAATASPTPMIANRYCEYSMPNGSDTVPASHEGRSRNNGNEPKTHLVPSEKIRINAKVANT